MLRKLVAAIIGVSALVPGAVFGLGMGEVELKSFLNQPLEARIELLQTRGLSSSEIIASLASTSEFSAAGVERSFFLSQLKFDVVQGENGETFLQVSSKRPVTEPFLNFLVEVQWPAGRLLREYTLLLDPPEFKDELPLAIRAPVASQEKTSVSQSATGVHLAPVTDEVAATVEGVRKVEAPESQAFTVDDESKTDVMTEALEEKTEVVHRGSGSTIPDSSTLDSKTLDTYTVKLGDTLSGIVKKTQINPDILLVQALVAYQYLNPEAFIDNNMNLVKSGAVLRIPTESQIWKVGRKEALQEIAAQNKAWRAKANARAQQKIKKDDQLSGRQFDGTGRDLTPETQPANLDEGRLSLVTPGTEESVQDSAQGSGDKGDAAAEQVAVLKDQLALETEEVEKFSAANEGLVAELQELDHLVEKTDKVLSLKDDQIASLQTQLEALRKDADMAGMNVLAEEMQVKEEGLTSDSNESVQEAIAENMDELEEVVDVSDDELVEKSQSEEQEQEQEFDDAISQVEETPIWANPMYLGIGGALLIAVLGLLWLRSRSEEEFDEDEFDEDEFDEDEDEDEDEILDEKEVISAFDGQELSTEKLDRQLLEAEGEFDIDTVLSEADIYVAYGHFPKAIAMLEEGLKELPESLALNLKLMDVYAESKDIAHFEEIEATVRGFASDDETLSQINGMRKVLGLSPGDGPDADEESFSEEETQFLGDEELISTPLAEDEDFLSLADIEAELDVGGGFGESEETQGPVDDQKHSFEEELTANNVFSAEETQVDAGENGFEKSDSDDVLDVNDELDLGGGALDFNFEETSIPDDSFSPDDALADIDEEIGHLQEEVSTDDVHAGHNELITDDDGLEGLELDVDLEAVDDTVVDNGVETATSESEKEVLDLDADFSLDDGMLDSASVEQVEDVQDNLSGISGRAVSSSDTLSSEDASLLDGVDEVGTKLDLATAYIEMGDHEGAKDILDEVLLEGNDEQQQLARELLEKV